MLTIIQQLCIMKQKHTKYTQINTNKSTRSEMGPVWQHPIQRTVRAAQLSALMTVHSFSAQYNTEQFWSSPLSPPDKHHSSDVYRRRGGTYLLNSNKININNHHIWSIFRARIFAAGVRSLGWNYFQSFSIVAHIQMTFF